ncbi:2-dehydro-3-deoxygalactonokinase [Poseidonocella sp. HB161398]|uniref:2-dehydro-3-deoxygalactonokinase n=1 Tax=Poseidonocella sp. HB161398 TaxID=2320855 RepID=UPI0011095BB7|nr:2-dehydro-3-deoxygalactonokinase [Poseidonocella sp. HB161398]
MTGPHTALIALDWGTSSLRAYRMGAAGEILETRSSGAGIQHLPAPGEDGFEAAFEAICGDWLAAAPVPVVAAGMVGSAQGWREVPYLRCPAGPDALAGASLGFETRAGHRVTIAPGLIHDPEGGTPDVMRGEEIQIAGTLAAHPEAARDALIVLPGTHSKWASLRDGQVAGFATYMTGELFAVFRAHSILGRLMPEAAPDAEDWDAFGEGLERARDGALGHALFSVRTLGLTGRIAPEGLADYMSGLLIGHEILAAAEAEGQDRPLYLVGEGELCRRYERALSQLLGRAPAAQPGNPAPAGLFSLAGAAGLLAPEKETSHV